ncbi:MAG TPA: NAD-dependent deacylase [Azospira sp.]|nr:NAD-dependent deacylase [Azospira sp.]
MTEAAILDAIAAELEQAQRILFITGAGISADSGLPTYRGIGGLYEEDLTAEGFSIEEALSGAMLQQHPEITWKYLFQIEQTCRGARPNRAHQVIAELEKRGAAVTVFTQNIDGLHRDAGSADVIEIHGRLHHLHCTRCHYETEVTSFAGMTMPPSCPRCFSLVRPRVVLFGESLPEAEMEQLIDTLEAGPDMVFSIGTSSLFPYVAEPVLWANSQGIPTVEINPGQTPVSPFVDYRIQDGAAATLEALWKRIGAGPYGKNST